MSEPYVMWVANTTFRKNGAPVLGHVGASVGRVVVFRAEEFGRLLREVPALADVEFSVGEFYDKKTGETL